MNLTRNQSLLWRAGAVLLVAALGAIEDWYGRFEYYGDTISYLEISNAVLHGDWALALNPYWSLGYPLILAVVRFPFAQGSAGEWTAIHVANLLIFLAVYASFLRLLRLSMLYLEGASETSVVFSAPRGASHAEPQRRGEEMQSPSASPRLRVKPAFPPLQSGFVYAVGTACFLFIQLMLRNVSQINPDLLVSGLFFLATAECLQFALLPRVATAVRLGLLMGFGFLVKAVFLPLSAILFFVVLLHIVTRPRAQWLGTIGTLAWVLLVLAVVAVPYIAALSANAGHFTLGESGSLNYAWGVNGLPKWTNWQGGPSSLGQPVHPAHMVSTYPHVFVYPEPLHVTYPPWFNPFYWYEGYHRYFSWENQVAAWKLNLYQLAHFFIRGPKAIVVVALVFVAFFLFEDRKVWWTRLRTLWPLYLPSVLAIGTYLCVIVEQRYLTAFLIILFTTPFLALFLPTSLVSSKMSYALVLLMSLGFGRLLIIAHHDTLHRFLHRESYADGDQWRAGAYLVRSGAGRGEKVAMVRAEGSANCTWAYVSGLHIVAEIGDNCVAPQEQADDFAAFVHHPATQETVFDFFRQAGATRVVVLDVDGAMEGEGWEQVPGTRVWVHRL